MNSTFYVMHYIPKVKMKKNRSEDDLEDIEILERMKSVRREIKKKNNSKMPSSGASIKKIQLDLLERAKR